MYQYNKTVQKNINYDDVTKENIKYHNSNWPQIFFFLFFSQSFSIHRIQGKEATS